MKPMVPLQGEATPLAEATLYLCGWFPSASQLSTLPGSLLSGAAVSVLYHRVFKRTPLHREGVGHTAGLHKQL